MLPVPVWHYDENRRRVGDYSVRSHGPCPPVSATVTVTVMSLMLNRNPSQAAALKSAR